MTIKPLPLPVRWLFISSLAVLAAFIAFGCSKDSPTGVDIYNTRPAAPSGVQIIAGSSFDVSWRDNSVNELNITISAEGVNHYGNHIAGPQIFDAGKDATSIHVEWPSAMFDTLYVKVWATNHAGNSDTARATWTR